MDLEAIVPILRENLYANNKKRTYNELFTFLLDYVDKKDIDKFIYSLEENGVIYTTGGFYKIYPEDVKKGIVERTRRGTNYIMVDDTKFVIKPENMNGALNNDLVLYQINENNEVEILKILKRRYPKIVCEIREKANGDICLEPQRIKGKLNVSVNEDILRKIGAGNYVLVKMGNLQKEGKFDGEVLKKINIHGTIDEHLALIAYTNDFEIDFSEKSMEEANNLPDVVLEEEILERKENDFRDEIIFTIDGADTKDIDDAISLKILPNGNYELGVHIANVSYYLNKCPHLLEEAKERSTSLYMLNTVIPMLPPKLSNGICSLNPNEDRLAKSVIMEIDHSGKIVNSRICDSVINSKKKMNYHDVNTILIDGVIPEGYEDYKDILLQMNKLSKILTARRLNEGQMCFANHEVKISLDDEGNAIDVEKRECLVAEKLIENFMIAANETVAEYVSMMDLPFVYRVHEGPNKYKLDEALNIISSLGFKIQNRDILRKPKLLKTILEKIKDTEEFPVLSSLLLRSMSRAKYDSENISHFALASDNYTHFTSPIRRFPDTMVHFLLDYYNDMALGNAQFDIGILEELEDELKDATSFASYKERQADYAEYQAELYKTLEYMRQMIGQSFEATINMISSDRVEIITDEGISGVVKFQDIVGKDYVYHSNNYSLVARKTKQKFKIGHRVGVTVLDVDDYTGKIYFSIDKNLSRPFDLDELNAKTL